MKALTNPLNAYITRLIKPKNLHKTWIPSNTYFLTLLWILYIMIQSKPICKIYWQMPSSASLQYIIEYIDLIKINKMKGKIKLKINRC